MWEVAAKQGTPHLLSDRHGLGSPQLETHVHVQYMKMVSETQTQHQGRGDYTADSLTWHSLAGCAPACICKPGRTVMITTDTLCSVGVASTVERYDTLPQRLFSTWPSPWGRVGRIFFTAASPSSQAGNMCTQRGGHPKRWRVMARVNRSVRVRAYILCRPRCFGISGEPHRQLVWPFTMEFTDCGLQGAPGACVT